MFVSKNKCILCHSQAEVIINYHIGETVLSLQKTTLIPGGSESLVYTTLSGGIGILVPFTSHEVQFLKAETTSAHVPMDFCKCKTTKAKEVHLLNFDQADRDCNMNDATFSNKT